MDMFVEQTHELSASQRSNERPMRFTDTRMDEQARAISLKAVPMSLVMEGARGKSYVLNLVDTPGAPRGAPGARRQSRVAAGAGGEPAYLIRAALPCASSSSAHAATPPPPPSPPPGHVNFSDELSAALRLSDGVLLVVDAVEGVMVGTERAVKAAAAEGLPICLVIAKFDRWVGHPSTDARP